MKLILENWREYLSETETGKIHNVPTFDSCFNNKEKAFAPLIERTLEVIEMVINKNTVWPQRIECMTEKEIKKGEKEKGGHGLYVAEEQKIKINPNMDSFNIYINFIHENIHHAKPELTGEKFSTQERHIEINEKYLPAIIQEIQAFILQNNMKEQLDETFVNNLMNFTR
jgi:hypothetical protein